MRRFYEEELASTDHFIFYDREDRVTYGDWNPPCGVESLRRMPTVHSSTMMLFELSLMMAELCEVLSLGDARYYADLALHIKRAFIEKFYEREKHSYGYWGTDGVALKLGLYPEGEKEDLLAALIYRIKEDHYAMPTGIYANKYLIPALLECGCGDVVYDILFHKSTDSFATLLDEGGTTLYEQLDMRAVMPREKGVGSYNHPMHGSFLYAYYTHLAGILPTAPGFKEFLLRPCHIKSIQELSVSFDTAIGNIALSFSRNEKGWKYRLFVPANSTCRLCLDFANELIVNGSVFPRNVLLGSGEYEIQAICR